MIFCAKKCGNVGKIHADLRHSKIYFTGIDRIGNLEGGCNKCAIKIVIERSDGFVKWALNNPLDEKSKKDIAWSSSPGGCVGGYGWMPWCEVEHGK